MALPAVVDPRFSSVPLAPEPSSSSATQPHAAQALPTGRLALRLPDGSEARLDRRLTIGQSRDNDVVLKDPSVSRRHCVIEPGPNGSIQVRDNGSTNGTWVNGLRVSSAELQAGALLSLGSSRLRVAPAGADHSPLVGESEPMRRLRRTLERLAGSDLPVLINGETGTGKELVALAIHRHSGRARAFVPINCGSIPKELVESELFGHERGAFTGATGKRQGVFQEADGGTLFLDEIGELPMALQPRLLRTLESGKVRPVGANREIAVTVRVVAATHVDLRAAIAAGRFREDLYYRMAAAVVTTPPLRERAGDIALLARHLLAEIEGGRCQLTDGALALLESHAWPGNVRELKNVLKLAAVMGGPILDAEDLNLRVDSARVESSDAVRIDGRAFLEIERDILSRAIKRHRGNRRAAALALGIPKSTLCDKAKRYGILD